MTISLVLVGVFLLVMLGVGVWGLRKTKNVQDFFIGGRSVGAFVSALAYGTTYFSAVLFIGFAGKLGWGFGLNVLWIAAGNALFGSLLAWLVLGHRTRVMSHNLEAMTMPEFFEARYGSAGLRIVSAFIIFIFLLPYSASVFKGLGHLFEANFGISYQTALIVMTLITGVYLTLGGYFAVAMTDFIQGLVMLVGSVAMVAVLTGKAGGLSAALTTIGENYVRHVPPAKQPGFLPLAALVFMTSFGTWGLPQMVMKFYAIKNEQVIRVAAVVTTLFAALVAGAAYFTGALSHVFIETVPMIDGKPAFDEIIPALLKAHLPEGLMALILLLVLSASMSTLSSLVLVSSSAIAIDLHRQHHLSEWHNARSLRLMRILSVVFVLLSLALALRPFAIILVLMSLSWGAVAGAFLAPYLYGLYWKRATCAGAWAALLGGAGLGVGLFFKIDPPQAACVAIIAPLFILPLVSAFTRPPETELVAKAFTGLE